MQSFSLRPKEDQNVWNFLFSALFVLLLVISVRFFYVQGFMPQSIPVFDALLIALAVFRITRLLVYDKILRFMREWFVTKRVVDTAEGKMVELHVPERGLRRTIHDLLRCPWCIGIWAALGVVFCYFVYDWSWYVIFMFAAAGVSSLVQLGANALGWKAELGKLQAEQLDRNSEHSRC